MADETHYDPVSDAPKESQAGSSGERSTPAKSPALSADREKSAESRPRLRAWMILAAIVLVVAGFFVWRYLGSYESTDDAQVDGHLNNISARVSGYVQSVNVDDNQYVEKGAVLVQMDPRDYQIAVERAKADLADAQATATAMNINVPVQTVENSSQVSSSEADVQTAQAGVGAAEKQLDAARAQLQEAEANNTRAQVDATRYRELVAKDEVSQQVYDQSNAAAKANAAAVEAARASVAAAEQQVNQAQGKVSQTEAALRYSRTGPQQVAATRARALAASAQVQQKQAALEQANLDLQYCTVVAPVSGIVTKNVEVGLNVQPGQTLLTIVPLDDVWVTANFKETQLGNVRPGQRVTFTVDANSHEYHGHVASVAGASGAKFSMLPPENATGNYVKVVQRVPVKIVLDSGENSDHLLRLGMSVEPKVWQQ